jgi:cytochrome c556
MRTMLGSLHDILVAALVEDTAAMRRAATRSGLGTAVDPALEKLLPEGFLQLGTRTHQQFDDLAAALATGISHDSIVGRLAQITGNCVSCHASYRLEPR